MRDLDQPRFLELVEDRLDDVVKGQADLGRDLVRDHPRVHVHQPEDQPADDVVVDVEGGEALGLRGGEQRSVGEEVRGHG
jgi:hypothetical protein